MKTELTFAERMARAEAKRKKLADVNKISYSIDELAAALSISRTRIYDAIAKGELIAHKFGRRTLILVEDMLRWVKSFKVLDLNA